MPKLGMQGNQYPTRKDRIGITANLSPIQKGLLATLPTLALVACNSDNMLDYETVSLASAGEEPVYIDSQQQEQDILSRHSPQEVNEAIITLAQELALKTDKALIRSMTRLARSSLGNDRDEFLLNDILNNANPRALDEANAAGLRSLLLGDDRLRELAATIPYASVYLYIPEGYEGDIEPTLIAASQYPEDDTEPETIYAFDGQGVDHILDGELEPDSPVLVIGISESEAMSNSSGGEAEQTDEYALQAQSRVSSTDPKGKQHCTVNHNEYISKMYLYYDSEPWHKGYAEIYALWAVGENATKVKQEYTGVNKAKKWYNLNAYVFSYNNCPENMYYKVQFWERDYNWRADAKIVKGKYTYQGNGFDIEAQFSASGGMGDNDDHMGNTQMYFYHPDGGTFTTGGVKWIASY